MAREQKGGKGKKKKRVNSTRLPPATLNADSVALTNFFSARRAENYVFSCSLSHTQALL